jgi:orotate phosphoribosyltransferase
MGGERVTDAEVLQIFRDTHALLDGHFLLRSGLHSRQYFQCALVLQHPRIAERLCGELAAKLKNTAPQAVVSPAMGGRNFQIAPREKILVIEDVVTRGGRVKETIDIVRGLDGNLVGVGTLVDRSDGKVDFGIPFESLLKLQIDAFDASLCPLCRAGTPVTKPGS